MVVVGCEEVEDRPNGDAETIAPGGS